MFNMGFELPTFTSQGELSTNCTIEGHELSGICFFVEKFIFLFLLTISKKLKTYFFVWKV